MQRVTLELSDTTFARAAALGTCRGYLTFQVNELIRERVRHTVLVFLDGRETWSDNLEWTVCDLCRVGDRRVAVLGELGEFRVYEGTEVVLDGSLVPPGSQTQTPLRGIVAGPNGELCATGTLLSANFLRNGHWQRDDPPIPVQERLALHERAFERATFMPGGSVVAVGWAGEAWQRSTHGWARIDSPTSVDFFDVVSWGSDAALIACGQLGTISFGTANSLEVLPQPHVTDDLWSISRFRQRVFCASATIVYELHLARRELAPVEAPDLILPTGSGHLSAAGDEVLWSTGPRELYEWNGQTWQLLLESS